MTHVCLEGSSLGHLALSPASEPLFMVLDWGWDGVVGRKEGSLLFLKSSREIIIATL